MNVSQICVSMQLEVPTDTMRYKCCMIAWHPFKDLQRILEIRYTCLPVFFKSAFYETLIITQNVLFIAPRPR